MSATPRISSASRSPWARRRKYGSPSALEQDRAAPDAGKNSHALPKKAPAVIFLNTVSTCPLPSSFLVICGKSGIQSHWRPALPAMQQIPLSYGRARVTRNFCRRRPVSRPAQFVDQGTTSPTMDYAGGLKALFSPDRRYPPGCRSTCCSMDVPTNPPAHRGMRAEALQPDSHIRRRLCPQVKHHCAVACQRSQSILDTSLSLPPDRHQRDGCV
jgi:hypothetical protein